MLVAAVFSGKGGSGSYPMVEQMLRGWPKERLIWWHPGKAGKLTEGMCCHSFGPGEIHKWMLPYRRFTEVKCRLFEALYFPRAVRSLRKVIREEKPEVVWMIPHGFATPIFHRVLATQDVPRLHVSIHDMTDTNSHIASIGRKRANEFQSKLQDIYARSQSRDCVTEEMSRELERCTSKKADLIIKYGAEPEQIRSLLERGSYPRTESSDVIRIGYAGTITSPESFALFVGALQLIKDRLPRPIELHVFSDISHQGASWFDATLIRERGFLSGDEFTREYSRCDWGLSVLPLEDTDPRYSNYSIPCKSTRTLADGIPLICLANRNTPLFRMISEYTMGFVSDSRDKECIAGELLRLFKSEVPKSREYVKMATLLEKECNAAANRSELFNLLQR